MVARKKILDVLNGGREEIPPIWLMRQAGRYLPEYQKVRASAGGFLELVFNPELASEVTLQPIRRYGFDAAILFSDILVVPQALGRSVRFDAGEGPRLLPADSQFIASLPDWNINLEVFSPVYETVGLIREGLRHEGYDGTALIGFAGAPWTVACYMIEGGGSHNYAFSRSWAENRVEELAVLIESLSEVTIAYLVGQVKAGAEVLQIFDSWAGLLTDQTDFRRWVIEPTRKIVMAVKEACPHIPVIGFPRGAGPLYEDYVKETGVQAIALDQHVSMAKARNYQSALPVQGNLDPEILRSGEGLEKAASDIISALSHGPHIFNLGHGIVKETPPEHIARLMQAVRRMKE
ncbi:MAG: uroporphyrinogen decarboxylase [Micavibrio aeruginosavorus]|uniref:Uroporphyrinogen decarboxylase n=1 Tax=Micavibrio aeruginosavorus TaxID=349221 RepID=A0A7T5R2S0_9BACT|nr:MAG: uroporphyrinogen decarboxylase [Micavibrio aeruginosavorus]